MLDFRMIPSYVLCIISWYLGSIEVAESDFEAKNAKPRQGLVPYSTNLVKTTELSNFSSGFSLSKSL